MSTIVPGSEPFYFPGGSTGCLLLHGFAATPEEMRLLGEFIATKGHTVIGVRLAGHATHPNDLKRTRWTDWLDDVQDNLALLSETCTHKVLVGQSMGGMIALTAAAQLEVSAVVALSTPYGCAPRPGVSQRIRMLFQPTIHKAVKRYPRDHPLYHRRELNYPAYPEFPNRIFSELNLLAMALMEAIPRVKVPTLLIHSRNDQSVPFACMQSIYDHLGSPCKEMLALDGMDHSLVRNPKRQVVFEAVDEFLSKARG